MYIFYILLGLFAVLGIATIVQKRMKRKREREDGKHEEDDTENKQ